VLVKPAGDARQYRVIVLQNGLEAVLVSDVQEMFSGGGGERTQAAVSMNVSAGNLQDPHVLISAQSYTVTLGQRMSSTHTNSSSISKVVVW
jgi:hypothetical protein